MGIEVKKLIIKTVIGPKNTVPAQQSSQDIDISQLKAQLLSQCRQIIKEALRREKER